MVQNSTGHIYDDKILTKLTELQNEIAELEKTIKEQRCYQIQETSNYLIEQGIKNLTDQAVLINELASKLEFAIFQFQDTALEVSNSYRAFQLPLVQETVNTSEPFKVLQVYHSKVPTIIKCKTGFILTAKNINLFSREVFSDFHEPLKTVQLFREGLEQELITHKEKI